MSEPSVEVGRAPGPGRGEMLFLRGMAHLEEGREAEGVEDLEGAARHGWLEARFQLAQHYARKGRRRGDLRGRAISHLQQVLTADPDDATLAAGRDRVCFALGGLYAEGDEPGDVDRGIAAYRQGLSVNPLSAAGHNSLGQLLMRFEPLGALGEFKVALQLDPDLRAAYGNLARLLLHRIPPRGARRRVRPHPGGVRGTGPPRAGPPFPGNGGTRA